jgi:hypothetical protein
MPSRHAFLAAARRRLRRTGWSLIAAAVYSTMAPGRASAADYYVAPAPAGSDANPGSLEAPFASLQKGHDVAKAGDTVWLRAGRYQVTKQIKLSKSGQSDTQRIKFWAYRGEHPLIDFSGYVTTNTAADVPALLVTGNWLHLKGLEIANVPVGKSGDHSISALRSEGASNNVFELLDIHDNFGPGLFISKGSGGNLVLNCDSHDNYDKNGSQGDGQNADGFGVHYQESGPSTIVRGCRAWFNSDDGYDLISQEVPVTIEGSWATRNGYADKGATSPSSGNGNGFKAGSSTTGIRHLVQNDVAWKNRAAGFYANHSSGGNTWLNNTSYMNSVQYNMLASPPDDTSATITLTGDKVHQMRNNVGFPNKNTNMDGVDSLFNTWDLGIAEMSTDFASTMDAGYDGPRQADGSLPALDFLQLKSGSPLVDKGTDVGLPAIGAPDLGAYELGATKPSGGAGGSAGPAGNGPQGGVTSSGGAGAAAGAGEGEAAGGGGLPSTNGGGPGSGGAPRAGSGSGGASGGAGSSSASSGTSHAEAGARPAANDAADDAGCACRTGAGSDGGARRGLSWLGALVLLGVRRKQR